ncbi:MAG: cytochrome c oxidase subunit II [Terriglobia bacterium]
MWSGFPLRPDQASTIAEGFDHLFYFETAVAIFFAVLIFSTIFYFAVKYRRRSDDERPAEIEGSLALELTWTLIPAALCAIMFYWGSSLYFTDSRPPAAALEVFVVGKQWMWHLQHAEGPREINELHVPVGRPIKLTLTSEDVIHDFFVPAFRVKHDVVPGQYYSIWFQATKIGKYHFFCAQYCGAQHSSMIGWVYVMSEVDYEQWLTGGVKNVSMAQSGAQLYQKLACITCHGTGRAPAFNGIYGKPVKLTTGQTVTADEAYIRESIIEPSAKIVDGYNPIMPTFKGQVSEEELLQLIAFIKSLGTEETKVAKP